MKEFRLVEELASHANVIKVHDIFYNKMQEKISILMEYAGEGNNLCDYIKKAKREEQSDEAT